MECLSRTGAVELKAHSSATDRLLFPGLDEALKSHHELAQRYQNYWPAPAAGDSRRAEDLSEMLHSARAPDGAGRNHPQALVAQDHGGRG